MRCAKRKRKKRTRQCVSLPCSLGNSSRGPEAPGRDGRPREAALPAQVIHHRARPPPQGVPGSLQRGVGRRTDACPGRHERFHSSDDSSDGASQLEATEPSQLSHREPSRSRFGARAKRIPRGHIATARPTHPGVLCLGRADHSASSPPPSVQPPAHPLRFSCQGPFHVRS